MIIDCDRCEVRGTACGECVVGVLLGVPEVRTRPEPSGAGGAGGRTEEPPGAPIVQFDAPERRALDVLADQGLVPRLQLVVAPPRRASPATGRAGEARDVG